MSLQPPHKPQSFQLPDLFSAISTLELRTNKHCTFATQGIERWTEENDVLTEVELRGLSVKKIGLLAALCFPTCDGPQLRQLAKAATVLIYSNTRTFSDPVETESLWRTADDLELDGFELLNLHPLLRQLRLSSTSHGFLASQSWKDRFSDSVKRHFNAREQTSARSSIPTLNEYSELRKDLYGENIIFLLAELHEAFIFPKDDEDRRTRLITLKELAFEVIALSLDVLAYQQMEKNERSRPFNIITVLMQHQGLSLQGAVNVAGNKIRSAFTSFTAAEASIFQDSPQSKPSSLTSTLLEWLGRSSTIPVANDFVQENSENDAIKRYIQALKDCIVGSLNWAYETEMFFGGKGAEVRSFGWVFTS
ncbi:isoprenoid synthase domain-containing protein [Crepidotus variabilis]|uniref:Isoprenoid synthase domain-containing protein n=1 Tax=Crepidotus variabilis TaxID=179855 RepID=A0A9P6JP20_9AGAR|nr:isoprenoid synthase domain-containing protein [Crepidotus variabilis]